MLAGEFLYYAKLFLMATVVPALVLSILRSVFKCEDNEDLEEDNDVVVNVVGGLLVFVTFLIIGGVVAFVVFMMAEWDDNLPLANIVGFAVGETMSAVAWMFFVLLFSRIISAMIPPRSPTICGSMFWLVVATAIWFTFDIQRSDSFLFSLVEPVASHP